MGQQKFSKLLEKFTIARKITGGVLLLHLTEQSTCSFKCIALSPSLGSVGHGLHANKEALGIRQSARPFDLAVIGEELA